jgi:orotate phosphoribosyltransferase-like protein
VSAGIRRYTAEEMVHKTKRVISLWDSGLSRVAIARELHIGQERVGRIVADALATGLCKRQPGGRP